MHETKGKTPITRLVGSSWLGPLGEAKRWIRAGLRGVNRGHETNVIMHPSPNTILRLPSKANELLAVFTFPGSVSIGGPVSHNANQKCILGCWGTKVFNYTTFHVLIESLYI